MFTAAHYHQSMATPGVWESIVGGGPLMVVLHFLLAASVIAAPIVIARRPVLPWMLLASCAPFLFAAAAAHIGYLVNVICLCGEFIRPDDVSRFIYPTRLFKWGLIISLVLVVASLWRHRHGVATKE